jgi:hypothetical protein
MTMDAIKYQLPSRNKVSIALDGWTSTITLNMTLVIVYSLDQNWALREGHLAFKEVDCLFFSGFKSFLRMIGQGPIYRSKACDAFKGHDSLFSAYRCPFALNYV